MKGRGIACWSAALAAWALWLPMMQCIAASEGTAQQRAAQSGSEQARRSRPPNIVFIISDDQGYTDFGFMGHPVVQTPHIDRLAAEGATFPNGYVPSSLCRPSLATLLTGLYPHQHKIHFNDPPDKRRRWEAERLIRAVPTLPRMLAEVGYVSLQTGKFWEGHYRNAGFTEGMTHGDPRRAQRHPTLGVLRGRHGDIGLTIGRDTMKPIFDFIDRHKDDPFFIWYAPMMPHLPYTAPRKYLEMYEGKGLHPYVVQYYAMCTWFDDTVGQLLDYLDKSGLRENTLVVFVVDNGWTVDTTGKRPRYGRRSKRSPFEFGVRTPVILRWPGRIRPEKYNDLVSSIDLVPTALAAAGLEQLAEKHQLPGINLLPVVFGQRKLERKAVFGEIFTHDASTLDNPAADLLYRWVRCEEWKLIDAADPKAKDMLFNLRDDPGEERNLIDAPAYSGVAAKLRQLLDAWWNPAAE